MSLPNTAQCQELFNACAARNGATWDHSAIVKALEWLANHEIAVERAASSHHAAALDNGYSGVSGWPER
jgi:hypothetical protein